MLLPMGVVYRRLTRRGMGDISLRLGGGPLLCDNITTVAFEA